MSKQSPLVTSFFWLLVISGVAVVAVFFLTNTRSIVFANPTSDAVSVRYKGEQFTVPAKDIYVQRAQVKDMIRYEVNGVSKEDDADKSKVGSDYLIMLGGEE
ncbi:MAG: hypothetical protein KDC26_09170 [Armatimonadetes bacterium]|nr:hypothetical protein [Armatimonadota bacterium]